MNLRECVWEIRYRIIMKTILQEKVKIHYSTTTWFTNFSYASSYENSCSKSSGGQRMGKIGEHFGVVPDFPAPYLDGQVLFPGVTHRVIKRYQKVRMQSWRTARNLIRLRLTRRSEQMTNCIKFSRTCQMSTNRSSTD